MSKKLTFEHRSDGTTALVFTSSTTKHATPLPRALIVDGHYPRPHADVLAVISWLAWPRYVTGTIAFGSPVSVAMGRALEELPSAFAVIPYSIDPQLAQRSRGSTSFQLDNDLGFGQAKNNLGDSRAFRVHVLEIDQWRGRLLSGSSIHVSANARHFEDWSWPHPGIELPTRLAVALLFGDSLGLGELIVVGERPVPPWTQCAERLFEVLKIDLSWVDPPTSKAIPL